MKEEFRLLVESIIREHLEQDQDSDNAIVMASQEIADTVFRQELVVVACQRQSQ